MFTRSTNQNSNSLPADMAPDMPKSTKPQPPKLPPTKAPPTKPEAQRHVSIISNDLTILGKDLKIISKGSIQVDGEIQGEIRGVDVTVGAKGKVVGTVAARSVIVDGAVLGEIQAKSVSLRSSSRVEGDVHHQSLSMDQGAIFDGRSRRHENGEELEPQLDVSAGDELISGAPRVDDGTTH